MAGLPVSLQGRSMSQAGIVDLLCVSPLQPLAYFHNREFTQYSFSLEHGCLPTNLQSTVGGFNWMLTIGSTVDLDNDHSLV